MPATSFATELRCVYCETRLPLKVIESCPRCAKPGAWTALSETLSVEYDLEAIRDAVTRDEIASRPPGIWRYRELLPVGDERFRIDLGAGGTRLTRLERIEAGFGGLRLFAKEEGSNPTGSSKDRPICVA